MKNKWKTLWLALLLALALCVPALAAGQTASVETISIYQAEDTGEPVTEDLSGAIGISIAVALAVALVVCLVGKAKMNSVHQKVEARAYATGGVQLTKKMDQFTHTTQTRRKIQRTNPEGSRGAGGGNKP